MVFERSGTIALGENGFDFVVNPRSIVGILPLARDSDAEASLDNANNDLQQSCR